MGVGTHIRIGGVRFGLHSAGGIKGPADLLTGVARENLRSMRDDSALRDEVIRRVLSAPCATRCYVSSDGTRHNCNCASGLQWATDPEAQALEGCPARDVWSDARSLLAGHHDAGRGANDPIVCDCDDMTPLSLAAAAYIAWFAPPGYSVGGIDIGAHHADPARFALAIVLPPDSGQKERVAHAFGLTNRLPSAPQPEIMIPEGILIGGPWWVWDASAHFGMKRPKDSYYTNGELVAFELSRDGLDGLQRAA